MMRLLTVMLVAAAALAWRPAPAEAQSGYVLIVNDGNPVSELTTDEVARFFRKQAVRWENGTDVVPVDMAENSAVRERFSQDVMGRSTSAMKAWWQRQIFSGRGVPPVEKASVGEVLAFVRSTLGAIGYVAAGTALGAGVKAVRVAG